MPIKILIQNKFYFFPPSIEEDGSPNQKFKNALFQYAATTRCPEGLLCLIDLNNFTQFNSVNLDANNKPINNKYPVVHKFNDQDPNKYFLEVAKYLEHRYIDDNTSTEPVNLSFEQKHAIAKELSTFKERIKNTQEVNPNITRQEVHRALLNFEEGIQVYIIYCVMIPFQKWLNKPEQKHLLENLHIDERLKVNNTQPQKEINHKLPTTFKKFIPTFHVHKRTNTADMDEFRQITHKAIKQIEIEKALQKSTSKKFAGLCCY